MSAKVKRGDAFESKRLDGLGQPRIVTVVQAVVRGRPGQALVDSEAVTERIVWRCYAKRSSLLDPKRYTRREVTK